MATSSPSEKQNNYVLDRLVNYGNIAEGGNLPPRQRGGVRVPVVQSFQVIKSTAGQGTTIFTLAWLAQSNPTITVDKYNIHVTNLLSPTSAPVLAVSATNSPAFVELRATQATNVTFYIQTQLSNGMTSDLLTSPTTTGTTIDPGLTPSEFTANFPIPDSIKLIDKAGDHTTTGRFDLAAVSAGSDYVYTLPHVSTSLPGLTTAQTFTAAQTFSAATSFGAGVTVTGLATLNGGAQVTDLATTGSLALALTTQTASFTAGASVTYLCDAIGAAITATLPPSASSLHRVYTFKKVDSSANVVTITPNGAETIDGAATKTLTAQYATYTLQNNGSNWFVISKL